MSDNSSLLSPALPLSNPADGVTEKLKGFNRDLARLQLRAQLMECLCLVARTMDRGQDPLALALQVGRTCWDSGEGERMSLRNALGLGWLVTPAEVEAHLAKQDHPFAGEWQEFVAFASTLGLKPYWETCADSGDLDTWHYLRFLRIS